MFKNKFILLVYFLMFAFSYGCMTAAQHQQSLPSTQEREMTVGIVQKEIKVGMRQDEVAASLGSPNIVTRTSEGKETWIYDKIATEASYSSSSGGAGIGAVGRGSNDVLIVGMAGAGYSQKAGATTTTQKTLTVIIKFDKNNLVESFSYHSSKF